MKTVVERRNQNEKYQNDAEHHSGLLNHFGKLRPGNLFKFGESFFEFSADVFEKPDERVGLFIFIRLFLGGNFRSPLLNVFSFLVHNYTSLYLDKLIRLETDAKRKLFGFFMRGVFSAKRAVFIYLEPVGSVLFVLVHVVVALFALGARKSDFDSSSFRCHI